MEKFLKAQFKNIRKQNGGINPDGLWVSENRAKLLHQIGNTTVTEKTKFNFWLPYQFAKALVPNQIYAPVRVMMALFLVGVITLSSWIASASATESCLPGDICYGVKLAAEKTQSALVSVTGSKKDKASLHLDFAKRRADEAKKVVTEQKPKAETNVVVALKKLEENIQVVSDSIKENKDSAPEQVVEMKKEVEQKTTEIKQVLKEVDNQTVSVDISNTKQVVKDVNLKAVEIVVQTKEEGKVAVSDSEVKTMVEQVIAETLKDNTEVKDTAKATTDVVEKITNPALNTSSTSSLVSSTMALIFNTSTEKIESSNAPADMTPSSTTAVKNVVEQATKKVDATQKNLEEAKVLVDNNHLLEAIQKVKEVSEVSKEAEKTVSEVKKVVEEVTKIPVVPAITTPIAAPVIVPTAPTVSVTTTATANTVAPIAIVNTNNITIRN